MFTVSATGSVDPIVATVYINSVSVEMELDTGASVSVLNSNTYQSISKEATISLLEESTATLSTYTGQAIPLLGKAKVSARYNNIEMLLPS